MGRLGPLGRIVAWSGVLASLVGCANHAKQSVTLYESGDYAGAARAADAGLSSHPDDDALWQMRVRAALAQGDTAGIAKAYAAYRSHREDDDTSLLRDLAVATLAQALSSPSAKLKVAAIQAIEAAEFQVLADQVIQRLGDEDDRVAAAAAIAVLRGDPRAPTVASDMLKSENPEARRIAVDGLGKKVGSLAAADLEKAADDGDARVRRVAIYWVGQLKDRDAVELLTKRLRDPDENVRAASASALAKIGIGNLAAMAKTAVGDRALAVRLAGVELYAAAHRSDELTALTDDPDPMVAAEAAIALESAGPGATAARGLAAKALDRAAGAPEWTTRAGAANSAVRALGKQDAVAFARRLVADKEPGVRLAAARVLAHGGDRSAAAAIFAEALSVPETELQAAAELASIGDERGERTLDAAVRDPARSADVRATAAAAHRSARRITPGLVAALADANGAVRVEAAATIAVLAK